MIVECPNCGEEYDVTMACEAASAHDRDSLEVFIGECRVCGQKFWAKPHAADEAWMVGV